MNDRETRRDLFAAAALQGLLANPDCSQYEADDMTTWAVEHADLLIEALDKPRKPVKPKAKEK